MVVVVDGPLEYRGKSLEMTNATLIRERFATKADRLLQTDPHCGYILYWTGTSTVAGERHAVSVYAK